MTCSNIDCSESRHCLVCDITTKVNYHFGSTTCLACASFFRRTVSLGIQYVCLKDGKCSTSHVVRSGCRACRFKQCETAGMKPGSEFEATVDEILCMFHLLVVRGKRDVIKTPEYVRESVQPRNEIAVGDNTPLTIDTIGSPGHANSPSMEKELNTILNVTNEQLMQFYIELNQKPFYPLSRITFDMLTDYERKLNQEATSICQNCPGTDLLDLMDMGILFRYVSFANLWLDGLWAELRIVDMTESFNTADFASVEELPSNNTLQLFDNFKNCLKENVGRSLQHLNLDFVEYAVLKSFCIWKLGIIDFGTTLKILSQEHYSGVTSALTEYYKTEKDMDEVESALRIANMTLLLGPIFNSYRELVKLQENRESRF